MVWRRELVTCRAARQHPAAGPRSTGERREVSVLFVDIRDFTPFAEANSAVVPAVVAAGGHVNKS